MPAAPKSPSKAPGRKAPSPKAVVPTAKAQKPYAQRLAAKAKGQVKPPKRAVKAAPKIDGKTGMHGARTATGAWAADPGDPKYTEITPLVITGFLAALAQCGMPTVVAREQRIHYMSLRALYREDEGFRQAWDAAMASAFEGHEDEVRRRAFQGYEKKVYQQGMLVGTQTEYSDTLAVMMIKAGKPELYNPKTVSLVEHAGSVGVAFASMTDEDLNKAINEKLAFLGVLGGHSDLVSPEVQADEAVDLNEVNKSMGSIES